LCTSLPGSEAQLFTDLSFNQREVATVARKALHVKKVNEIKAELKRHGYSDTRVEFKRQKRASDGNRVNIDVADKRSEEVDEQVKKQVPLWFGKRS